MSGEEEIERLREDNERLRELLGKCVPYIWRPCCTSLRLDLIEQVRKEVGDE